VSKNGHTLAAVAVGGYIALALPHCALLGLVTALAGRIPDTIEGVTGFGPSGERRSLIPHRTLSHSPWTWAALLLVGLLLPKVPTPFGAIAAGQALAGIGAGAVLHLVLDLFSPTGIPLGNPFGARTSFGPYLSAGRYPYLYRTSTSEEWPLLLPFAAVLATEIAIVGFRLIISGTPDVAAIMAALTER
jgi:membrane-bound metal-dependent hydrolase YbcI (DUF457 family)